MESKHPTNRKNESILAVYNQRCTVQLHLRSQYYSQAANAVLKTMLFDTTDFQFDNKQFKSQTNS